eukprot:1430273-Rhodomonas_salina.1
MHGGTAAKYGCTARVNRGSATTAHIAAAGRAHLEAMECCQLHKRQYCQHTPMLLLACVSPTAHMDAVTTA